MKIRFTLICFCFLLFLISCSSDEETISFVGEYRSISLTYTDCDDPDEEDFVWQADDNNSFCIEEDDAIECFSLIVRIFEDGSFEHTFFDEIRRGGFSTSTPDRTTGTYTIDGANIELCPSDNTQCILMSMNDTQTALLWQIQGNTCKRTYTIIKQ